MMDILNYEFARNAVVAVLLLAVIAGVIGTYIVVRRMVFVSGGITHASFGGIGIASFLGVEPVIGAVVFAILTALGIEALSSRAKVREDSAIAILWSFGMAIGLIFMFLTPGYTPNLMGFMFGDILAITKADVVLMASLAVAVTACAAVFYRPIMYIAFSPDFATLTGWRVRVISAVMSVVVALSIVLSIKAVGIVLVLSIFTIPQAIATLAVRNLAQMMCLSSLIAVAAGVGGLAFSFALDLPVGPVITALLALAFGVVKIFAQIKRAN